MRIISTKDVSTWSIELTCRRCEAKLEASVDDFRYQNDRDGDCVVAQCPVCAESLWLSASVVPTHVKNHILGRPRHA